MIFALQKMRLKSSPRLHYSLSYWASLKEGVIYVWQTELLRNILALVALVSMVGLPYSVLLPVYVRTILHGGPAELGFLMGSVGAGALSGALYLASRRDTAGLERLIYRAPTLFGLALIFFSQSRWLLVSMMLCYLLGLGMMMQMASSNIMLQTHVEESKRGRVMSMYAMAFMGMTPLGGLMLGTLTTYMGLLPTLLVGGCLCLTGAIIFARKMSSALVA